MRGAILTPSFFGLCTWTATYLIYISNILTWEPVGYEVHWIFLLQIALFFTATYLFSQDYMPRPVGAPREIVKMPPIWATLALHAIGFAGIAKFAMDFSPNLTDGFLGSLLGNSSSIRALGAEMTSIGIQFTYFGWLAIGVSLCYRKLNIWLLAISLVQLLSNFIFIDRTRPLWIMFTALLCFLYSQGKIDLRRIFVYLSILLSVFVALFAAIAMWSGKKGVGLFDSDVNPIVGSFYLYLTAGFAYFGHMLQVELPPDYIVPERIFYPIFKILSTFGLSDPPPDQILDVYEIPFPSNVGTALEPFYHDGGFVFLIAGMLIYSFGFNLLGLWLLKSKNAFSVYAWATLCFCNLIGFFTPKIGNFPLWLFMLFGVMAALFFARVSSINNQSCIREHGKFN